MSDFDNLKRNCLKRRELYEDPDFPANQSSVFYHQTPPFQFTWKRPKEICSNPVFIQDGSAHFDVVPGKLGDRWFVSSVGCLSLTRGLFYRVVPADQNFSAEEYAGIFRFRLWWGGEWQEILVDDRLPTVNNKLVFVQSQHTNQFWASLLEKAYAKLHGSYEALKYGCTQDGLGDLTGGVTETVNIRQDPMASGRVLNRLLHMTSVITAAVQQQGQQNQSRNLSEKLANGILLGINYRVKAIEKVEVKRGDQVHLVRLRNPLGLPEYAGNWGRESEEWLQLDPEEKDRLKSRNMAEGEFWMTYQDFVKTFTTLEIVHLDGETSKDEASLRAKSSWNMKLWHGSWQKGVSAGGCRNNLDTFHINPQFQLILPDTADVIICLSQHSALEPRVIGFAVYQGSKSSTETIGKTYFKRNKSFLNSQYSNSRQICHRCQMDQGSYLLIPTTFEPGHEASFTLRVYSGKPLKLKVTDSTPSLVKPAIIKAPPSFDNKVSCYEAVFLQVADEHKSVNAFELQELLEACLPNDYVKSCATLEVCRQVILAFDSSGVGRLKFNEYKSLMCSLKHWQNSFKNHTKGTSGILRSEKLKDTLLDIGFQLNTETLSLLVLRYIRKDGTLRFGDFVSCILHLSVAFATFEKKDPLQNGYIKMNLSDWLKASLQC